ncbi:acetyl-CoA C-acetyltransferase [Fodinisporobacter ferrooxydans]|uniref:acetyl-CoA C-acetyltransferase n=1 Tax=Fodinisporobacter ferrooxydans TaxID=2901836 RepID=A0ABY4CMC9_9BACL|nr:acetyl-CoA C-acetyltransferase [Alicyclobacillaceae bacterium MYW30-H2]
MGRSVIVSAARTPFGKFGGSLSGLRAVDLGGVVLKAAMERAAVEPEQVDEVIMGMVLQAGAGQIPSRQAARNAGLPWTTPTETINKVCASGLRAVTLADQLIRAHDADVILAGGMESMSNAPYSLPRARFGMRMGDASVVDLMIHDGLRCAFDGVHMAVHGSEVAKEYGITREEQDVYAVRSQQFAISAQKNGIFTEEIVAVEVPGKKGETIRVDADECPRPNTSLDTLRSLPPVFAKDGSITAGNAPGVNDGAGALLVMSEGRAHALGKQPLATILGHAEVGAPAPYIATTPALAIQKLLQKHQLKLSDIDLFELNEAFAAVVLTSGKLLGLNYDKVNVNGGAIAFGHPIGASGARIVMTLIYELRRRGGGLGIAAICSGAAQGDAVLLEVKQ